MLPSRSHPDEPHLHHPFPSRQSNCILPIPLPLHRMSHCYPSISKMRAARSPCRYPCRRDQFPYKQKRSELPSESISSHHTSNLLQYHPSLHLQNRHLRRAKDFLLYLEICHLEILGV